MIDKSRSQIISVVIPALNEERQIVLAIRSAWDAGADEVIVVDGGSTDETVTLAEQSARVVPCPVSGRGIQQNHGARHATGQVLLFLHADCRLTPSCLTQLREAFASDNDLVGGCFRQAIDAEGARFRALEAGNALRARMLRCMYGDQAIFVRKEIFRRLGGFPDVRLMEDLLFSRELRRAGRILLLDGPVCVSARRWVQRGVVRQTLKNWALVSALWLGASPNRLTDFYPNDR